MDEKEQFKMMVKSLRDLADRIEKRELKPVNMLFNRKFERIENDAGDTIDFKSGTTSLTVEWETVPKCPNGCVPPNEGCSDCPPKTLTDLRTLSRTLLSEQPVCAHGRPHFAMCPWCNGINSPVPTPDTGEKADG